MDVVRKKSTEVSSTGDIREPSREEGRERKLDPLLSKLGKTRWIKTPPFKEEEHIVYRTKVSKGTVS